MQPSARRQEALGWKSHPIVEITRLHFQDTLLSSGRASRKIQCAAHSSDAQLLLGAQHDASGSPAGEVPWVEEGYSMAGNQGEYRSALVKHNSLVIPHPCSSTETGTRRSSHVILSSG